MDAALIELIGEDDSFPISGIGFSQAQGIKLAEDPEEIFDMAFERSTIPAGIGGRFGKTDIPVRHMQIALNVSEYIEGEVDSGQIDAVVSRLRRLFGPVLKPKRVKWQYTPPGGDPRWLWIYLSSQIKVTPTTDWHITHYVRAVVNAVAVEPRYESAPHVVETPAHAGGEVTYWLPVWNPTDQDGWIEWTLDPGPGPAEFTFADFSFGQEQDIDVTWTPGQYAARTIPTPEISVRWSVMSVRSGNDPYVAADLSNADGQMGGVYPLFPIPPHTGSEDDPVLLPVTINGPAGAKVRLEIRRFWSAESGIES